MKFEITKKSIISFVIAVIILAIFVIIFLYMRGSYLLSPEHLKIENVGDSLCEKHSVEKVRCEQIKQNTHKNLDNKRVGKYPQYQDINNFKNNDPLDKLFWLKDVEFERKCIQSRISNLECEIIKLEAQIKIAAIFNKDTNTELEGGKDGNSNQGNNTK